ncbi:MAG: hypothetical protein ABEJ36_02135 [Candidatus Nanosalina sp.]
MSGREEKSEDLISRVQEIESDIKSGLNQLDSDIDELETAERKSREYEKNLDSLSQDQLKEMERDLEISTEKGQEDLEELQRILGMEKESVKTIAQVLHFLDEESGEIEGEENEIDSMLENLKEQAENGKVDEELAARCLAEIMEVREELKESAELEEEAGEAAQVLGAELSKSHKDLVETKREEINLREDIRKGEEWASQNDVTNLERFLEEEEAPNLKKELNELSQEINEEKEEEDEFLDVMQKLAEEGELTEDQIDKLIAEQQTWSAVMKQSITNGTLSAKKFADAIYGFTPAAIAAKAGSGAVEHVDKDDVMKYLGNLEEKIRDSEKDAEESAETAVQEAQSAEEQLREAKG